MPTNLGQFNDGLDKFDKQLVKRAKLFIDAVATDVFKGVAAETGVADFGSPVWSGRFLASHRVSVGSPDGSVAPVNPDFAGVQWPNTGSKTLRPVALSTVTNILRLARLGDTIFVSNNLPYARFLEEGGSRRAPQGVYRVAVERVKIKYRNSSIKARVVK